MSVDQLESLRLGLGRDGKHVPAHQTLGVRMGDVTAGCASARMASSPVLLDSSGVLLPGALAVLADTCCGTAVASELRGTGVNVTAQMRVEFVRPVRSTTRWIAGRAEVDVVDDEGGLARGELLDDRDELVAVASMRSLRTAGVPFRPAERPAAPTPRLRVVERDTPSAVTPVHDLLGVLHRDAADGRADWTLVPDHRTANSLHAMHGGVVAMLAHLVATDAQRSVIDPGEVLAPLDLVVNFYRSVDAGGTAAHASASVTHRGRRFVVAEGEITAPDGRIAVRFSVGGQIRRPS